MHFLPVSFLPLLLGLMTDEKLVLKVENSSQVFHFGDCYETMLYQATSWIHVPSHTLTVITRFNDFECRQIGRTQLSLFLSRFSWFEAWPRLGITSAASIIS